MNNQNVVPTPGQFEAAQPQSPRLPKIEPQTFDALNTLDGFIAKAPLTRQEHQTAHGCFQHLMKTCEEKESLVAQLREQLSALQASAGKQAK